MKDQILYVPIEKLETGGQYRYARRAVKMCL